MKLVMMDNLDMRVRKKLTYFLEINIGNRELLGEMLKWVGV